MAYDREEDILYTAHQLWEEDDAPTSDTHAYWQRAALQVLARGRVHAYRAYDRVSHSFSVPRAVTSGPTTASSCVITSFAQPELSMHLQFGTSGCIEMNSVTGTRTVMTIKRTVARAAVNQPFRVVSKTE
jgi:hypothetical protein